MTRRLYPLHQQRHPWAQIDPLLAALPPRAPYGAFRAIARRFGVPLTTLRDRRRIVRAGRSPRRLWTAAEDAYLCTHWRQTPTTDLAARLQRSRTAVQIRAYLLDLGPKSEAGHA